MDVAEIIGDHSRQQVEILHEGEAAVCGGMGDWRGKDEDEGRSYGRSEELVCREIQGIMCYCSAAVLPQDSHLELHLCFLHLKDEV